MRGTHSPALSRGWLSTKFHALVEGLGNPARFTLTEGQVHDTAPAETLLRGIDTDAVVADKGIGPDSLVQTIDDAGAKAVIPPRSNRNTPREYDVHRYKHCNLIECLFCRIKHFCRIATRDEKLAQRPHPLLHRSRRSSGRAEC